MSSQKTKYHLAMLSNLLLPFREICTVLYFEKNYVLVFALISLLKEKFRDRATPEDIFSAKWISVRLKLG